MRRLYLSFVTLLLFSGLVNEGLLAQNKDLQSEFEQKAHRRLILLSKKTNKLLLAISVLAGLNVVGFSAMAYMIYKRPR